MSGASQRMEKRKILIVDDDDMVRDPVAETLKRKGYEVEAIADGQSALDLLARESFDLVISDFKMPGMNGIELLEKIRKMDLDVPFLIMTAYGTIDIAVDAVKKGASDFLEKGENISQRLELKVEQLLQLRQLLRENKSLKSVLGRQWDYIGSTKAIEDIRTLVKTVADSRSTVLITGESGTGKELIARAIHFQSPRHNRPFVKVNCAALPEGLIESELFGHEKGAFTGALNRRLGKFELASGGTLLLDEIGEMQVGMQAKLLRVLQEREINKVGGDDPVEVDIRLIATTNRDLDKEVKEGRFRDDLFYRLNVIRIHLPPLRERKEDIKKLAEHFTDRYNRENGLAIEGMEDGCWDILTAYDWPGNIRELENAVERAVVLTRTGRIKPDLMKLPFSSSVHGPSGGGAGIRSGATISQVEKELIIETLAKCNQNRTKAASLLGISIRTLRNKLNEYGMAKEQD
jgi:DNA-binding NtrC family response regulator